MPALGKLRQKRFDLSPEDRLTFAGYIVLSYARVPAAERVINRLAEWTTGILLEKTVRSDVALKSVVEKMNAESGESLTIEQIRKKITAGNVRLSQSNRGWSLDEMFMLVLRLQPLIFRMNWTFLLAPEGDNGFLTSDNPVSLFDSSQGIRGIGFASSRLAHFTFPISREICLLAGHRKLPTTIKLNSSKVRRTNSGTMWCADSQLYAPFKSDNVQKAFESVMARRQPRKQIFLKKGMLVEE